jgi:hypothetical protein
MFETAADQADGLRRMFAPREPALIPIACCAPAEDCRRYAGMLLGLLRGAGLMPILFDRLDLSQELGEVQAHTPVDRVVLLDEPVRLARWLGRRHPAMLLFLSSERDALPPSYATIKSIVTGHGVRQFVTAFVDAPTPEHCADAHYRLASCARRFLDVEMELLPGAAPLSEGLRRGRGGVPGSAAAAFGEAALTRLNRFGIAIAGGPAIDPLVPAEAGGIAH